MTRFATSTHRPAKPADWKGALALIGLAAGCLLNSAHAAPAKKGDTKALADLTTCAKPVYPAAALAARQTGTVTLGFLIGTSGKVIDSKVKKSSGHPALDDAAQKAIEQCAFIAGTSKGTPVESWMGIDYVWTL